jgi:hypothetical protein
MKMVKIVLAVVVVICAVIIIQSFFMPWAKVSASVTKVSKQLTEEAAGPLANTPFAGKFIKGLEKATKAIESVGDIEVKTQVSGYDIPTMVNKKSSKIAISFAQSFFKDAQDLDKKSMLVFLIPILAVVCVLLAIAGLWSWIPVVVMLIISGAISITGIYNLKTVNISSEIVAISFEKGIWQTMYAYLTIFIVSIIWLVSEFIPKPKK